jgi:type I site-specific restriction endonuclease
VAQLEQQARQKIDGLLAAAGWHVFNLDQANIHAARGVAIREFPLESGFGFADYLLYVDGKAAGIIEAKKQGATLTGVEFQSGRYAPTPCRQRRLLRLCIFGLMRLTFAHLIFAYPGKNKLAEVYIACYFANYG